MPEFSPEELAHWSGGTWSQAPESPITSVGHDTRTLKSGALYVALPGARVDGHDVIPQAIEFGASAVLCQSGRAMEGQACLEVEDPAMALRRIANGHRKRCSAKVIGITGSAGKTTAKDFLAGLCRAAGPTCATPGNWNNFIGLPLSMLRMEPTDEYGVFELGMNHAGEIAELAAILEPEFACITSIGEAHLEQLGSVAAIAQEKTSLFSCLPEHGMAVIDLDSDWEDLMRQQNRARTITCSLYGDADMMGQAVPDQPDLLRIEDRVHGDIWEIEVPLPGDHMRKNMLQAVVLARACGIRPLQMIEGIARYEGSPMRWEKMTIGTLQVINDAYNANPLSMKCAVQAFSDSRPADQAWAVLGEMGELGEASSELHKEVGRAVDTMNLQGVVLVGEAGRWMAEGMSQTPVHVVATVEEAVEEVTRQVPGDGVLFIKASRSVGLEKIVIALKERSAL